MLFLVLFTSQTSIFQYTIIYDAYICILFILYLYVCTANIYLAFMTEVNLDHNMKTHEVTLFTFGSHIIIWYWSSCSHFHHDCSLITHSM